MDTIKIEVCPIHGRAVADLGPTEAVFESLEAVTGGNPIAIAAAIAVKEGSILKLDAVDGSVIAILSSGQQTGIAGKWYGTIAALGLFTGPYDRKSQAMNSLPLALLGVSLRVKEPAEDVVIHLGDGTETLPSPIGRSDKAFLRDMTPAQLETGLKGFMDDIVTPFVTAVAKVDARLAKTMLRSAEDTVQSIRDLVAHSA